MEGASPCLDGDGEPCQNEEKRSDSQPHAWTVQAGQSDVEPAEEVVLAVLLEL